MNDNLKASINKGESVIVDSYIYKNYIVYRYHRLNHFNACSSCSLHLNPRCYSIIKDDKNNPQSCKFYTVDYDGSILLTSLRYSYEMINMSNISLFLSRLLIKRYEIRIK